MPTAAHLIVRVALAAGCAAFLASDARAQQRMLSIDAIYDPVTRVNFSGDVATDITWIDDATYLVKKRVDGENGVAWLKVDAGSGRSEPLFDATRLEASLARLPGVTKAEAAALSSSDLVLNPERTAAVVTVADDLYLHSFGDGSTVPLTSVPGREEEVTFSPDGRLVAFVRAHNLYVVDTVTQRERALTTDGSAQLLNGKLDWLYQEEIYGRGRFRAYWWSPDSARIAFLQLNERPVPEYTIVDEIDYRPRLEVTDYPKAGDPNPTVRLGIARVTGGEPAWADIAAYSALDILIVNVDWTPDGRHVVFQVQDREQTWLDLNLADAGSLRSRRVLRETTKAWVNENGNPVWLKDGSFLWISERTGFRHLYHYKPDGMQLRQVTNGRWDVRTFYGFDEASGTIYFGSSERSPIGSDVYRIKLDGSGMTRLSQADGTHRAVFNPSFTRYIGIWSNVTTPTQVRVHAADGSETRVADANPVKALGDYRLAKPEFLQVKTRDGFVMEAMMIKPPGFDPSRRYPVFQHTYAGPGASQVRNAWGGQTYLFHQLLAQNGIIVWILDNRSASGKGAESQWPIHGRLGELELQDLEDGIAYLRQLPYVDSSRIALSGWSYGGFMTGYALTHSTSWAAGIVGAPVTDWRNYDSVYTERLMKLPQNNPDGYRRTSPAQAAANLRGKLLLIHGTIDDNVHMQNSIQFAYELQKAGKPFEMMVYPKSRHGITDPRLAKHLRQGMFDFVMRTIGARPAGTQPTTASR